MLSSAYRDGDDGEKQRLLQQDSNQAHEPYNNIKIVDCVKYSATFINKIVTLDGNHSHESFGRIFEAFNETSDIPPNRIELYRSWARNGLNFCKLYFEENTNSNLTLGEFIAILNNLITRYGLDCSIAADLIEEDKARIYEEVTNVRAKKKIPIVYYEMERLKTVKRKRANGKEAVCDLDHFLQQMRNSYPGVEFVLESLNKMENECSTENFIDELRNRLERLFLREYQHEIFLIYDAELNDKILNMDFQINTAVKSEHATMRIFYAFLYHVYCERRIKGDKNPSGRFYGFCLDDFQSYISENRYYRGFKYLWLLQSLDGSNSKYAKMVQLPFKNDEASNQVFLRDLENFRSRFSYRIVPMTDCTNDKPCSNFNLI